MNHVTWIFGRPGSGKTTLGKALASKTGAVLLDSDDLRLGLNRDLGFSVSDRHENIRRLAEMAQFLRGGWPVVVCAVTPSFLFRKMVKEIINPVHLIHLQASATLCESRGKAMWPGHVWDPPVDHECAHLSAEASTEQQVEWIMPFLQ